MKEHQERICIYFIIDNVLPLVLYVGETMRDEQSKGGMVRMTVKTTR